MVSWAEVCCATGFPPEVLLAAASSREPPVLREEVEGRSGREGGGGRQGGRELVYLVPRRRRMVEPQVLLMSTRVPLVRGLLWRVHLQGSQCLTCRSDQAQGCESHTPGQCCCKDGQGLLGSTEYSPIFFFLLVSVVMDPDYLHSETKRLCSSLLQKKDFFPTER